MVYIKEHLLLIGKVAHVVMAVGFFSHYLNGRKPHVKTPYNGKYNVLRASLNKTFASFLIKSVRMMFSDYRKMVFTSYNGGYGLLMLLLVGGLFCSFFCFLFFTCKELVMI